MRCENAVREETGRIKCKTTGYLCNHVPSEPRERHSKCIFDPVFSNNLQMQAMVKAIHEVEVGSKVWVNIKSGRGSYSKLQIESLPGRVLTINAYGHMEVEIKTIKFPMPYELYHLTRIIFLDREEQKERTQRQQEEIEEEERIYKERREEDIETWSD